MDFWIWVSQGYGLLNIGQSRILTSEYGSVKDNDFWIWVSQGNGLLNMGHSRMLTSEFEGQ